MTDAQVNINKFAGTCTEIKVRSTSLTNTPDWKEITDKLEGRLVIKNYPELTKIELEDHELEGVIVINCPKLEKVSVRKNKLTELDITKVKTTDDSEIGDPSSSDKLESIVCGGNPDLEEFSVEHCPKLKSILAPGSSKINRIPGLDKLENLENIVVAKGLFGSIFPEKIKYFREAVETIRKASGLSTDEPLPSIDYTDSDGKVKKKIDKNALETKLKDKIIAGSSQQAEKVKAEEERDAAQNQLATLQAEKDQLQKNLQDIVKKLGLTEQSTQTQILTKIEELINKPDNDNSDKVSDLERQLSEKGQKISELETANSQLVNKQTIAEGLKNSPIIFSDSARAEIASAASSQEAWKIRDRVIEEKFAELNQTQQNAFRLNVILGILATLCLLLIVYLVVWKINPMVKDKEGIPSQPKKKNE